MVITRIQARSCALAKNPLDDEEDEVTGRCCRLGVLMRRRARTPGKRAARRASAMHAMSGHGAEQQGATRIRSTVFGNTIRVSVGGAMAEPFPAAANNVNNDTEEFEIRASVRLHSVSAGMAAAEPPLSLA